MALLTGSTLAHYRILGSLGAGAMGEVYRAQDSRLEREVAIKVLPEHFAGDEERLRRFEREAKALASLNHPNVAQIFGVDQVGDVCFLVLELVEGETLEERLARGPLPLDEALDVARQIAEGLEAAHEAGVIHRDLKPANVRLTPDGKAKVLDFGLAKPAREGGERSSATDSVLSTEAGRLLGTPTYMAPEQARGRPIDKRVDIWAFGCVLYECLTARRAFEGETLTDVLDAVLHAEPDLALLPARTPRAVRELVTRSLARDPRTRVRDIGEARQVLERARSPGAEDPPASPLATRAAGTRQLALAWSACLAAVLCAAWLALARWRADPAAPSGSVRTHVVLPPDMVLGNIDGSLALAPDGRTLAFSGARGDGVVQLWIRPLDSLEPQPLAGTGGGHYPFWSPDGRTLAFFAEGKLKRIPAGGGSVTTLCDAADPRGGTWTSRNELVFAPAPFGGLFRVPAAGGVPEALTEPVGRTSHRVPHALPDGPRVLFSQSVASEDERDGILLLDLDTRTTTRVSDDASDAHFVAPGELWFVRNGNLMGQPFDAARGALGGQPRLVAERVTFNPSRLTGRYSAARDGTLVYQPIAQTHLEWFDLEGRSQGRLGQPDAYVAVSLSPDGRRAIAFLDRADGGTRTALIDLESGLGALQPGLENTYGFAWSPDSRSFAFGRPAHGEYAPFLRSLDGGSQEVALPGLGNPWDWSRDGLWISLHRQDPVTGLDVWAVRADGSGEPQPVAASAASEWGGVFSPDARWVVFLSDQSGRPELHVLPFGRAGSPRPITSSGVLGTPAWLDDGRIVYQTAAGELHELDTSARGNELEIAKPRPSFGGRKIPTLRDTPLLGGLSLARDGTRLLAIVPAAAEQGLVLVQRVEGRGER